MPRAKAPLRGGRNGRSRGSAAGGYPAKRRPRFRLYLALALLAAMGIAFLLRSLLLAALASPLVGTSRDAGDAAATSAQAVLVLDGDRRYAEAARLLAGGAATEALVVEDPPNRLILGGFVPGAIELTRRELARSGIAEPRVTLLSIPDPVAGDRDAARALGRWLDEHPATSVAMLCDAFTCGRRRLVFSRVLAERAAALVWVALPDRRYSRSSWWQSEAGVLSFVLGWATLLQARLVGDAEVPVRLPDASAWLASAPGGRPPLRRAAEESPAGDGASTAPEGEGTEESPESEP